MYGIVHDFRIQAACPPAIRFVLLVSQPLGVKAARCRVAGAGKGLLERRAGVRRIERRQSPRMEQGRLGLLTRLRAGREQAEQGSLSRRVTTDSELSPRQPLQQRRVIRE